MGAEVRLLLLGVLVSSLATNIQGVQQTSNPRIIEHPEDQYVAKNEPATLNCKAEGEPPPIITWYRDGKQVTTANENPKSHRMLLPSGQLFFLRIIHNKHNKPDVGVYYCNATNPETKVSVISKNATLEIAAIRDDFREMPKNTDVAVGDTAILDCRPPRGSPDPRVKWKKDGDTLALNSRISLQDEGSLMIQDANKGDSGMYTCVATNIAASKETPAAKLSVLEKPAFIILPQDVSEYAGQNIAFGCEASGDPPPTIIWKREDGSIPSGRSHIGKDRSLHIDNISVQDEGNYVCRAENAVGHVEAMARLSVFTQPSFIVTPKDKTVGVGRRVSLQCEVTGNPPPAVFWNRAADNKNLMFPRQEHGRFSVQDDGTLVIEPVRKGDEGEYVCQAYSVAGTALAKARLEVKDVDPRPPPIIHQGPQNQTLPLDSVAMLQCASSGDPRPSISWMKNNRALPAHDARITQLDSGTLQISDLKLSDTGMYTCKAESETGKTTWSAALVVEAQTNTQVIFHRTPEPSTFPGPPSMPNVADITETSMKLSWKANSNHGASPVFAYTVEYFSHETGEGWIVAADSISEQNYVVNNLRQDTAYMFLVRAQNSHGLSLPSSVTPLIRTQGGDGRGDQRSTLPRYDIGLVSEKLTGTVAVMKKPEVVSSTAIKLNWEVKKSHRYIEGYHIKYRVMPDLDDQEHIDHTSHKHHHIEFTILTVTAPGATMYVLRNLQKYQWYEIRIQPYYFTVEGQESNTVRVRTFEDVPSAPPQRISSKLVENNTLLLTWGPPPREHQNGALRGYRIYMVGNESKYNREIITNATTSSVLVRHLVPNMPYRIQMAAFNKMGDGVKSDPHIVGGDGSQGMMHGFARQPWFIATLIGTVGGTLWFALCVFSVWLYRKRKARKKMNKNGVMNVPVHKSEDPSRDPGSMRHNQIPMMSLSPTTSSSSAYPSNNNSNNTGNDKQPNGHLSHQTSFNGGNRLMQASMAPDVTQGANDMKDEKEPLYNTPSMAGMKTFNKALPQPPLPPGGPCSPYATTTLLQQNDSSAFRPIYQPMPPGSMGGGGHDMSGGNNSQMSDPSGTYAELPMDTCDQCGDHLHSPISECESMMDDPRYPLMGHEAPVLYLPPPPEQPPPSDIGTPPDSPTPRPRHGRQQHPRTQHGNGVYSDTGRGAPCPSSHQQHPMSAAFRTMSPRMHAEMSRAYSPRAMSEPERGPTPPVRAYKLVPINEPQGQGNNGPGGREQQRNHYSDTEAPMPPQRHSPPSPAPQDHMHPHGRSGPHDMMNHPHDMMNHPHDMMNHPHDMMNHPHDMMMNPHSHNEMDDDEYVGESDVEMQTHHPDEHQQPGEYDAESNVAASWASDVASEGGEVASSISSSDGSFLAEADFASAVAKAAELSGLTVVGSTVSDPNAGQKEKKYRKHRERSKQRERERPSSPYSTDSNYSSVPATRNPYPKSERKRQLQEHQRSNGKPRPPPTKAKPNTDLPSYNKPSYPTSYCPPPHTSGELRQNPLAAFDTSDTPIV